MSSKIKQQLIQVSKLLYEKGLVNAFEGNVSILEEGRVYITPSSVCKGFLTEDMIVVTDLDGNVIEGKNKPSSEIKLHLASYRNRKDINSVVHAHSPYATAYAVANKPIETKAYPEMIALFGSVPLARYGTPSTDGIWIDMVRYLADYDIILLANHGIVSVGKDAFDTFFKLESVESIAKTLFIAAQLGGEKELPEDELRKLNEMRESKRKGV